jgi:hypothetical protein
VRLESGVTFGTPKAIGFNGDIGMPLASESPAPGVSSTGDPSNLSWSTGRTGGVDGKIAKNVRGRRKAGGHQINQSGAHLTVCEAIKDRG